MREHAKLLLCVGLVSCTSNVDGAADAPFRDNLIAFPVMFSAFDGTHDYAVTPSVPSAAENSKDADPILASSIEWEVDRAFVKRGEFSQLPNAIKLTTRKTGLTTVRVTVKSLSGASFRSEAKLTISRAKPSEWDAGEERYLNGTPSPERRKVDTMCGLVFALDIPRISACSTCHNSMESMDSLDIEHTPTQTAGYSNEDLISIFTQGAKPAGGTFNSPLLRAAPMPDCIYREFHTWDMTDEEKNGVVWKLRSIPPKVREELAQR